MTKRRITEINARHEKSTARLKIKAHNRDNKHKIGSNIMQYEITQDRDTIMI